MVVPLLIYTGAFRALQASWCWLWPHTRRPPVVAPPVEGVVEGWLQCVSTVADHRVRATRGSILMPNSLG